MENNNLKKRFGIAFFVVLMTVLISTSVGYAINGRIFIDEDDEDSHINDVLISSDEAIAIAENATGGKALSVELNNEDGYLVWGVQIENADGLWDVKVDAGTGEILKIESDNEDE